MNKKELKKRLIDLHIIREEDQKEYEVFYFQNYSKKTNTMFTKIRIVHNDWFGKIQEFSYQDFILNQVSFATSYAFEQMKEFFPKCPRCKKRYEGGIRHSALSRRDNKTHICSACGVEEALEDFKGKAQNE